MQDHSFSWSNLSDKKNEGPFGLWPHLPSQIEGTPKFWLGIRSPSFRPRVGVKSKVVTNFLVWLA
jgi:hypothetical protein